MAQNKLRESLAVAIRALENDTVFYNWHEVESCNCGVMVQALTDNTKSQTEALFTLAKRQAKIEPNQTTTWREICHASCRITGQPFTAIFTTLSELGLEPKDVVHLEYLSNKTILKESGIKRWFRPFYYTKKKNLFLYLKAWLRILNGEAVRKGFSKKDELEADLLIATAFGNQSDADEIRFKITSL